MKGFSVWIGFVCAILTAKAQGTFQNLDFEEANIIPIGGGLPDYIIQASAALPNWTVYIGGSSVNYVVYDTVSLGSSEVSIHDSMSSRQPLQGNYSVVLQHSSVDSTTAGIGQTGQLPEDAALITFYVANYQTLQLTFASNSIPLVQLGTMANYSIYGGNIAAYAGQTGELLFTDIADNSQPMEIDNIQFSSVPEPSILGLLALCGLFFGLCRWQGQRNLTPG